MSYLPLTRKEAPVPGPPQIPRLLCRAAIAGSEGSLPVASPGLRYVMNLLVPPPESVLSRIVSRLDLCYGLSGVFQEAQLSEQTLEELADGTRNPDSLWNLWTAQLRDFPTRRSAFCVET